MARRKAAAKAVEGPEALAPAELAPAALQARVAEAVNRIRRERGWSLEELARRSGVSRAMLSQIEARKTNPTIAVLWKVSTALGLTFSALLGEEPRTDVTVLRRAQMQTLSSADGAFVSRPLFPRRTDRKSELYELRLRPGARSEGPPHPAGTRENLVVAQGGLSVHVGSARFELGEGDAIDFAADVPHAYENPGPADFLGYEVIVYR